MVTYTRYYLYRLFDLLHLLVTNLSVCFIIHNHVLCFDSTVYEMIYTPIINTTHHNINTRLSFYCVFVSLEMRSSSIVALFVVLVMVVVSDGATGANASTMQTLQPCACRHKVQQLK
jgi:hypothetical protein